MLLGKNTPAPEHYAPEILDPIARQYGRQELGLADQALPFCGEDVWYGWELSWLDESGIPQTGVLRLSVPCESPMLVESKSLKLYLNSLNQTRCGDVQSLRERLNSDISAVAGTPVGVDILDLDDSGLAPADMPGSCIDGVRPASISAAPDAGVLVGNKAAGEQLLYSHLLRSLCPVTGQPDWATLIVKVGGVEFDQAALLSYVLAFREHREFHEQCVERIFCDLMRSAEPAYLSVQALYTRRGGLDINPFRSSEQEPAPRLRSLRQ